MAANYQAYWQTVPPTWDRWIWVGEATEGTMTGLVVDNSFFVVASIPEKGDENPAVFPAPAR